MIASMVESSTAIGQIFHALADDTRRELIVQLSRGPASVSALALPLPVSLAAVVQHVQILEDSGLVTTRKVGRVRTCQLEPKGFLQAERWIAQRRALWEGRLERLDALLTAQTMQVPGDQKAPSDTTVKESAKPRRRRGSKLKPRK